MYVPLSNWRYDFIDISSSKSSEASGSAWISTPSTTPDFLDFLLLEDGVSELFTEDYSSFVLEDSVFSTVYKTQSITGASRNPHTLGSGPNHEGYVVVTFPEETPLGVSYFGSEGNSSSIFIFTSESSIPFASEPAGKSTGYSRWGTSPLNPYKGLYFGVNDVGADLGVKTPGPPTLYDYLNFGLENGDTLGLEDFSELSLYPLWGITTAWRQVPPAPEGFWTNYQDVDYDPVSALSSYEGYRGLTTTRIANAKVSTSFGPQYGLRTSGKYTYFNGVAPSSQNYTPYNTPDGNTSAQGYTGGGVTHGRLEGGILTNPTGDTSGSRASWVYNPPVYCKTFTETVRAASPGVTGPALRYIYRGKAGSYVSNFGSIYHQAPEGVRSMVRTFSASVNSSNQRS
jgi:hypothetical protein